jgi:hypothetical protein
VANLGDVAISLGPVLVTGVGAWVALSFGRATARDEIRAEDQRARVEREHSKRDHRESHYHDLLTLLLRFRDAARCTPRFPVQELRDWRSAWRRAVGGVMIFGSPDCRASIAEVDRVVHEIHEHWYDRFKMPPGSYLPGEPLESTDSSLSAQLVAAEDAVVGAMRADVGTVEHEGRRFPRR